VLASGVRIKRAGAWRLSRLPLARRSLAGIRGKDIADYIRARGAGGAGPNTIRLDLALLSHLFTVARPKFPRGRDRRLLAEEEPRLLAACRAYGGPTESIVALALETAMRRGEIAAMRWEHLNRRVWVLLVPKTKTGGPRRVPLPSRAEPEACLCGRVDPCRVGPSSPPRGG